MSNYSPIPDWGGALAKRNAEQGAVEQVRASQVQEEDVLPGLDNGYVIEVEEDPEVSFRSGGQYAHMGDGKVCITYHDSQGEECYLIVPADSMVQVKAVKR